MRRGRIQCYKRNPHAAARSLLKSRSSRRVPRPAAAAHARTQSPRRGRGHPAPPHEEECGVGGRQACLGWRALRNGLLVTSKLRGREHAHQRAARDDSILVPTPWYYYILYSGTYSGTHRVA